MKRRTFLDLSAKSVAALPFLQQAAWSADTAKRPNILFCIADDASYPHMGAYGCSWVNTPAFDRVARNGILFTRAYTPNAKCAPSRSCILTGRNSWELEEAANHWPYFPQKFTTYAEALLKKDYHVGYTGKGWAPGRAFDQEGNKRSLTGAQYSKKKTTPPTKSISKTDYAANFAQFLEEKQEDQPFCFWYGGHEPHRRYEYKSGIDKGNKSTADVDKVFSFWPDNETVRTDMLDYAYEIEYFDQHLQKILDLLEEKGELDNTLVVVTADNGMPFPRIKGQEYEYSNHLPLAIMWGNRIKNPGRVVDDYVSFIDFAPTFLQAAGVSREETTMQPITGQSLFDIFDSPESGQVNPERNYVLIGKERHDIGRPNNWGYPVRGIFYKDYLYLHNFKTTRWPAGHPFTGYLNTDGSPTKTVCIDARHTEDHQYWQWNFGKRPKEELYNIKEDPDCIVNLADRTSLSNVKEFMKKKLFLQLKEQGDPRMYGEGEIFDEYTYADDNWRGFYESKKAGDQRVPGWVNKSDFDTVD